MKNSNIANLSKKKKLLTAVLEYFLAHNDFPIKSEFRYKRVKSWPLLDEMERDMAKIIK